MPAVRIRALRRGWGVLGLAVLTAAGSCGSAPAPAGAVAATCRQVGAVLSDGPDPSADPVGYAEAQVLPLDQITSSDAGLRQAIRALASAYQQFFSTGGDGAAVEAVSRAASALDAICPGVAS